MSNVNDQTIMQRYCRVAGYEDRASIERESTKWGGMRAR